jgi:hypothetical protein
VTRVCVVNNVRYNPTRAPSDINWARGKSTDQLGALYRHITENVVDGTVFEDVPPEVAAAIDAEGFDQVYVLAEAAWRALAALELQIEQQEGLKESLAARVNAAIDSVAELPDSCPCGKPGGRHLFSCVRNMV